MTTIRPLELDGLVLQRFYTASSPPTMERTRGYAGVTEAYTSREAESKRQMRKGDKTAAAAEPAPAAAAVGGSKRARAPSAGRGLKDATDAANNKENKAPAAKRKAGMAAKDSATPVPVPVEPVIAEAPVAAAAASPAMEEAAAASESLGSTSSSIASVEASPSAKEEAAVDTAAAAAPGAATSSSASSSGAAPSLPLPVMKPADYARLRGIAHKKVTECAPHPRQRAAADNEPALSRSRHLLA